MSEQILEKLIKKISKLPGLGPRSSRRAVLHLLKDREKLLLPLIQDMTEVADKIKKCIECGNLDEKDICEICNNSSRNNSLICIVETVADLWALERSNVYNGKYHILGGVLSAIDGITASDTPNVSLSFKQSNPVFEIEQSTQDAITQYISGSQLIANPELVEMQHQLQSIRNDRYHDERQLSHLRNEAHNKRSHIQQLSAQLQNIERAMMATNLSPTQQSNYTHQASNLRSQLSSAKSNERSIANSLNETKRSYNHLSDKMHHLASDLSLTPAVVEVPVYSDYNYQEFTQTNSLNGVLYLNIDKVTRTASVIVSSTDTSHPAHPTINLAANAMSVLTQKQLMPQYSQERYNIGLRLINELIAEHKASFLYQAQDSTNLERKMTLLVQHGLVTSKGASKNGATMLNDMLITEFGQGGIFSINQLLHLY